MTARKEVPTVAQSTETDWVSRFADEVIAEAERRAPGKPVVCASGLSPSGPIHLGNLREVMTPHLVADEIRRRGYECVHILSWDDYDRYRKVPAGIDPSWSEHIGKPLTSVPAPPGSPYANWAEHFKVPMAEALREMGIEFHPISQTEMYTSGAYREQILHAMRHRREIDAVLDRYRTKDKAAAKKPAKQQQKPVDEAELAAAEGSGAVAEDDGSAAWRGLLPVQALLLGLRPRSDHGDLVRRRDHRAGLHLRVRPRRDRPAHRAQPGQAGLEGRLADALGV